MILAHASAIYKASLLVLTATCLLAVPAKADVMVIDADGARWVAGGPPVPASNAGGLLIGDGAQELSAVMVPEGIVANTQAHAAGIPAQYTAKIAELAQRFDLSPALLEAVVWRLIVVMPMTTTETPWQILSFLLLLFKVCKTNVDLSLAVRTRHFFALSML